MIAAAAVLLLYRFSFSVPGYEGRHFTTNDGGRWGNEAIMITISV